LDLSAHAVKTLVVDFWLRLQSQRTTPWPNAAIEQISFAKVNISNVVESTQYKSVQSTDFKSHSSSNSMF